MKPFTLLLLALCSTIGSVRGTETLRLASEHGAAARFSGDEDGWRLTGLEVPGGPEEGLVVSDRAVEISTPEGGDWLAAGWSLAEAGDARIVLQQEVPSLGVKVRRIFSFGPATNVLRIETWIRSLGGEKLVASVGLLDWRVAGEAFGETGVAPASFPVFGERLFAGIEHVSGESTAAGRSFWLMHRPRATVTEDWQFIAAAVVGWPLPGAEIGLPEGAQVRVAFLHYLDSVRVKPDRIVLHSETWWTMMPPLSEKDVLADIDALQRGFHARTGMFFDTYTLDLGWSDPRTFWRIADARFPNQFRTINERLNGLGAKLGLWLSPGSGYPEGLSNPSLKAQGYEMLPFPAPLDQVPCFALGTRYQREFKERLVSYAREYGLGHVILDFMPLQCDVATHGHPAGPESRYAIDAGVADVLDSLRAVTPNIALEPMVCGYPPSPWWLMKTPFILGPAGDDLPYGQVPSPEWLEALITARDVAYRKSQESWLMPTQSLETWDVIVQTPGEFENTAVMAIGRGRWFLSSYLKPSLMQPEDWDFYAALVRWARANKEWLGNAWMIGGAPADRVAYGYMFRHAAKDLFCVRNPWIEERTIELPASPLASEPRELRMIYPRRATLARLEPGGPAVRVTLAPYETVFLETVPAAEITTLTPINEGGPAIVSAGDALIEPRESAGGEGAQSFGAYYRWSGIIAPPAADEVELCVLVAGSPEMVHSAGEISFNGRAVKLQRSTSAGQFGAATDASPDNWVWFTAPLPKEPATFSVDLRIPSTAGAVGVYLRGSVSAQSEPEPEGAQPFPVFRPGRRGWSQTLRALEPLEPAAR